MKYTPNQSKFIIDVCVTYYKAGDEVSETENVFWNPKFDQITDKIADISSLPERMEIDWNGESPPFSHSGEMPRYSLFDNAIGLNLGGIVGATTSSSICNLEDNLSISGFNCLEESNIEKLFDIARCISKMINKNNKIFHFSAVFIERFSENKNKEEYTLVGVLDLEQGRVYPIEHLKSQLDQDFENIRPVRKSVRR